MTFVTPCSIGNIYLFPKTSACTTRKKNLLAKCSSFGKSPKLAFPPQRFLVPPLPSSRLFPEYRSRRLQMLATVETDVAIEESTSSTEGGDVKTSEAPSTAPETSEPPAAQSKRPRFIRKSEMPPVKTEELVPGATFTGKVRSIQPFGAFVDFGAFTDGLVHVSRMSDSFIKDVNSVVSIGQEVKVRIVEADAETGRISLTMRGSDDITKLQQQKDGSSSEPTDKQRFPRKNASRSNQKQGTQKASKFVKDQILEGTVKNLTRAGAFISLPDGEEGFLPTSEESEGLAVVMGTSSLQPGQEVSVRVLRITRGNVTLTMKKEENMDEINAKFSQGVVHVATNPFLLAFRDNKDVAAFLDEREKLQKAKALEKIEEKVEHVETESKVIQDKKSPEVVEKEDETVVASVETESNTLTDEAPITTEEKEESNEANLSDENGDHVPSPENLAVDEAPIRDELSSGANGTDEPSKTGDQVPTPEIAVLEATPTINDLTEESNETESPSELGDQITALESLATEEVVLSQDGDDSVKNEVEIQASQTVEKELHSSESEDVKAGPSVPEQNGSITSNEQTQIESEISTKASTISPALVKQLREETGAGMMDCKNALTETGGDITKAQEFLRKKGLASAEKKASRATAEGRIGSYIHDNRIGVLIEVNCETDFVARGDIFKELVDDLAMQVAACPQVKYLKTEDVSEEIVNKEREIEMQKEDLLSKPEQIRMKIVEGRIRKRLEELALLEQPYIKNDKMVVKDWVKQTIATIGENMKVRRFIRYNLGEGLEKKSQDFAAEVAAQTAAKPSPALPNEQSAVEPQETSEKPTIAISAALVKQLREETGAGMMDCKKALTETSGNLEKAQEYLRKKGLSAADKKSSRLAAEGRISSYIHDSRIGVLIEVNCETDFVGRSEKFKELVDDLAMQVVAYPQVQYVSMEDIPPTMVSKERELEMQREDLQSKPENIREKIVDGRVSKRLGELALLEQPFIKNDNVLVKDLVKQTVAAIGENIRVRRFVRFTLGEAIEDEKTAEVAEA